jgi:hypothetical protein
LGERDIYIYIYNNNKIVYKQAAGDDVEEICLAQDGAGGQLL